MIDGGPLRTSRPVGRQSAHRTTSVREQQEEPKPMEPATVIEQPRQQYRSVEPEQPAPKKARGTVNWMKWAIIALIAVVIVVGGWFAWSSQRGIASVIDSDKYQAVFLSNGQVYFGKLTIASSDYMQLTNVFYLERQLTATVETDEEEVTDSSDNNFQLLKYSDVLYGSEDSMMISRDDVIRFENLRTDGVVAKAIANRS